MLAIYFFLFFIALFALVTLALLLAYARMQRIGTATGEIALPNLLRQDSLSSFSFLHALLERLDLSQLLQRRLEEAALDWSVGRTVVSMLLSGAVLLAVAIYLPFVPTWGFVAAFAVGASLPYLYLSNRRHARLRKFEEQFPDALDSLSNALRAGHPMAVALQNLAVEQPAPLGLEVRKIIELVRLGRPWGAALENMSRRIPLIEVAMFVSAVETHMRTGGNLGEVLGRLSETMRETQALRGEVRALSAHGRLTGLVLTLMPGAVALILMYVQPGYFEPLLDHPQGKNLIFGALGMLLLAHFVIRWIVEVEA
jgi:tight adherence protein B